MGELVTCFPCSGNGTYFPAPVGAWREDAGLECEEAEESLKQLIWTASYGRLWLKENQESLVT